MASWTISDLYGGFPKKILELLLAAGGISLFLEWDDVGFHHGETIVSDCPIDQKTSLLKV